MLKRSVRRVLWLTSCRLHGSAGREAFVLRIAMWGPLGGAHPHGAATNRRSRR